jgi:hypothetical protein
MKWLTGWRMFYKERMLRKQAERTLRRRTAEYNKAVKLMKKDESRLHNWHRDIEKKYFHTLAAIYEEQTCFHSMDTSGHPAYQAIIAMGWDALPFIFEDMRKPEGPPWRRDSEDGRYLLHWFVALHKITGEDPTNKKDRGRIKKLEKSWLEWADRVGF